MSTTSNICLLRDGGAAVLLDMSPDALPRVLHWGADVWGADVRGADVRGADVRGADVRGADVRGAGEGGAGPTDAQLAAVAAAAVPGVPHGTLDAHWPLTVLPGASDGWPGRPALRGHRIAASRVPEPGDGGLAAHPRWTCSAVSVDRSRVTAVAEDAASALRLELTLALQPSGVLVVSATVQNTGVAPYVVDGLTPLLPVPAHARELLDLAGRWIREHGPQRAPLHVGIRARESWRGRPGHDGTPLLVAGTPGFGFRHGEVWGVHVACSGNAVHLAERVPEGSTAGGGAVIGGGELLGPGEIVLRPGERYAAPALVAAWSDAGLDGLSARMHSYVRARPTHPSVPRPVTLNTWDAVRFDHDRARLTALADRAAAVGVERFVLDDGWFTGRRDDTTSLGDWTVDAQVWPDGLHPLAEHVRGLGMQFGLWVEPEMISPDSELARAHPEWLLAAPGRLPRSQRHQQVLDLARPDAFAHVLGSLDALVTEYALDALKWDHNRDLAEPVHAGRPGVHAQTGAVHRLLDELRARHPGCEIESCAAGGGRADLAMLARTDRIWASDTTDPVERQAIQRWTGLLLPPELVGAHVGGPHAWTTARRSDLAFRLVTALFGHAGIEWDLTTASPDELDRIRAWTGVYRELRPLLHGGTTVRADHPGDGALLHGVVGDGAAVYAYVRLETAVDVVPPPLLLPGLDPARHYRVQVRTEVGETPSFGVAPPPWLTAGVELTGGVLGRVGLAAPLLQPGQAVLLHAVAS